MKKAKVKVTYAPFEVADYLDSEEAIAEYLSLAARDDNPGVLLKALGDVAKARGMSEVAKASGLGRESLYKTLAPGAKPRFETIATIMRALNVGFSVESRLPVRAKMSGEPPGKGSILQALRRSPLVGGDIAAGRQLKSRRR